MKTLGLLFTALFAIALTVNAQAQVKAKTQPQALALAKAQSQAQAQSQSEGQLQAQAQLQALSQGNDRSAVVVTATDTLRVLGNCGMCKARIEKAALEAGADKAVWEAKTLQLAVTYDPAKTDTDKISKKLAAVGHDTDKYKAPDEVYEKLPACCHYERGK